MIQVYTPSPADRCVRYKYMAYMANEPGRPALSNIAVPNHSMIRHVYAIHPYIAGKGARRLGAFSCSARYRYSRSIVCYYVRGILSEVADLTSLE